jgi:cysteinyl-tRNA synthetase
MLPSWLPDRLFPALLLTVVAAGAVTLPASAQSPTDQKVQPPKMLPGRFEAIRDINFRSELQQLVMDISKRGREGTRPFAVVVEGGEDLILRRPPPDRPRDENGVPTVDIMGPNRVEPISKILLENVETNRPYLRAIDAQSFDSLFYGYSESGVETPEDVVNRRLLFIDRIKQLRLPIWTADLVDEPAQADAVYERAASHDIIAFANPSGSGFFDTIPEYPKRIPNANANNVDSISKVQNFIKITDSSTFASKEQFVAAMQSTNYDAIVIDVFHGRGNALTEDEVEALKFKRLGSTRMVLAKVDVSRISDQAYFWKPEWSENPPPWIFDTSPDGYNYDIMFWAPEWREILFGRTDSYIGGIYLLGFDGVYLTGLDAYERYEDILYHYRVAASQ